ncbi:hypothetical protein [Jeotgalibacillus terrae]|uniref:Uncharacterized protein n=1 Tax=Jeotgalibacillus terrae TaxID=587735 RepID=A0ABW5ZEY8_9BACL|nr:hypothetical protein [Jeotgalibacillus terrae]MBM7579121.1 hypothetical protein [Jeotgalibacillus terrae]
MNQIKIHKWSDYKVPEPVLPFVTVTHEQKVMFIEEDLTKLINENPFTFRGDFTLKIVDRDDIFCVNIKNLPYLPDRIDMFSDGTVLLVSGRAWKTEDDVQQNARRYNMDGECLDEFALGDDIVRLSIDDEDTIWVGYSTEGVYGDVGRERAIAAPGLVAFSKQGEVKWEGWAYDIHAVLAMNVYHAGRACVHYSLMSWLVQLDHFDEVMKSEVEERAWISQFMMLDGETMLACAPRTELYLLRSDRGVLTKKEELTLKADGSACHGQIVMRGNTIFVFNEDGIYQREITLEILNADN